MDRADSTSLAPIFLESHVLPPVPGGDRVRRRGLGYTLPDVASPEPELPSGNRATRRRVARIGRGGSRGPLAALLIGPAAVLLAGPAAAATEDTTTTSTTSTTSTTVVAVTTTVATPPTTASPTTVPPTTEPPTTVPPTVAPTTTVAVAPPLVTTVATTAPRLPGSTSAPTPATGGPTTTSPSRPTSTLTGTVVPSTSTSSSTSTTTTVPGATVGLPVGDAQLPPETPLDADPVAAAASGAMVLHRDLLTATKQLTQLTDDHAAADAEVARLSARVAELTGQTFDLAAANRATAEVEVLRAAAQADLDVARTSTATLALRQAMASTTLGQLSDQYPTARLTLATLVTARTGGDARRLAAAWAAADDDRATVVFAALAQVGDPYVFATAGPDTFDCSGLTGFAWKAAGISLDHFTVTQRQTTFDVTEADLRPGDLVFNLDGPNGGHVMLYLGTDKLIVHAPAPGTFVSVSSYHATTGFGSPLADARSVGEPLALAAG